MNYVHLIEINDGWPSFIDYFIINFRQSKKWNYTTEIQLKCRTDQTKLKYNYLSEYSEIMVIANDIYPLKFVDLVELWKWVILHNMFSVLLWWIRGLNKIKNQRLWDVSWLFYDSIHYLPSILQSSSTKMWVHGKGPGWVWKLLMTPVHIFPPTIGNSKF